MSSTRLKAEFRRRLGGRVAGVLYAAFYVVLVLGGCSPKLALIPVPVFTGEGERGSPEYDQHQIMVQTVHALNRIEGDNYSAYKARCAVLDGFESKSRVVSYKGTKEHALNRRTLRALPIVDIQKFEAEIRAEIARSPTPGKAFNALTVGLMHNTTTEFRELKQLAEGEVKNKREAWLLATKDEREAQEERQRKRQEAIDLNHQRAAMAASEAWDKIMDHVQNRPKEWESDSEWVTCHGCAGSGRLWNRACAVCGGAGRVVQKKQ